MRIAARTIWDTRIQTVCSIVSARDDDDIELWLCANFGQAGLDPPRVIINPNRLYPIEGAIRRARRFAINVLPLHHRALALALTRLRRRIPNKIDRLGLTVIGDKRHGIPYLSGCLRTVLCEVEHILDSGDHSVVVASVLECRLNPALQGVRPLLYPDVSGTPSRHPAIMKLLRKGSVSSGLYDRLVRAKRRLAPRAEADLPGETYRSGGQTESEIAEVLRPGVRDTGRTLVPPARAPARLTRRVGLCVVGVGAWGSFHCRMFREADQHVELYVCGRDPARTARVARAVGARDVIIGLEKAIADPRVEALSLVLPHHLHAEAAQMAASLGKHVLVEKPIATTLADADAMIETARRSGTILMVAEDAHFRPATREAVRIIDCEDFGEPLYLQVHAGGLMRLEGWKADSALMGGGVLMDIGVHYMRAMRLLMGEPHRVMASRAMQVNTRITGEDSVQLVFGSNYGWQAHMLLSWAGPRGYGPDIVIAGEKAVIHLWPGASYLDLYPAAASPLRGLLDRIPSARLSRLLTRPALQRVRRSISDSDALGYLTEMREFLAAVAEGRPPVSTPEDARRDLEIVLSAYQALRDGHWVSVP